MHVRFGEPGLRMPATGLGQWSITISPEVPEADRPEREMEINRLEALANAGFLTVSNDALHDQNIQQLPARKFVMTQQGWEATIGVKPVCFATNRPEVLEITGISRTQTADAAPTAYAIRYKIGSKKPLDWIADDSTKGLFDGLQSNEAKSEKEIRLVKGRYGWLPEPLVKVEYGYDVSKMNMTLDQLLPPISHEIVLSLSAKHPDLKAPVACANLPKYAGDDADRIEIDDAKPVSYVLFDPTPGTGILYLAKENWKLRLEAMAKIGLFRKESANDETSVDKRVGTRYVLEEKYRSMLTSNNSGCLSLGETKLEVLPKTLEVVSPPNTGFSARFKGIVRVDARAWSKSLDWTDIPEVHQYLTKGIPVMGFLTSGSGEWKISGVTQFVPQVATGISVSGISVSNSVYK